LRSLRFAVIIASTVLFFVLFMPLPCFAADYQRTYWVLDHPDGSNRYQLTVSVTSALYDYYRNLEHNAPPYYITLDEFAQYVTPYALKPIANSLWSIYDDEEDFANGVLMIVHQIPYEASAPQKYPVETIVENVGDCDLFSFIAASIMMAGGLDVVLLYYEAQIHMNVGVNLPNEPRDARSSISYYNYNSKPYYVAETTGGNWEDGWRVGESSDQLQGASAGIITLEGAEQVSPGQVSSSLNALTSSSITLTLSSTLIIEGTTVTISGSVSPVHPGNVVTIYVKSDDSSWTLLKTVLIDSYGRYSCVWSPSFENTYYIRSSWSGDADHAGADSNTQTLRIIPQSLILIVIVSIALVCTAVILVFALKRMTAQPESPVVSQ